MKTKDNEKDESMTAIEVESERLAAISRIIDNKEKEIALKLNDPNADFQGVVEEMEELSIIKEKWKEDFAKFDEAIEAELVKIHEDSLVELQRETDEIIDFFRKQLADLEANIRKRNNGRTV